MKGPTMNADQRRAMTRLADLIDQEGLHLWYGMDDQGIEIMVNGQRVFQGWLDDSSELRAAIARAEQEPAT